MSTSKSRSRIDTTLASRCRLRKVCSLSTLGWWNGRHVRLRGVCRKACGFKSRPEHDFLSADSAWLAFEKSILMQIVRFHQTNSGGAVYAVHNRGVVAGWQVCDDCGFSHIPRGVTSVLNILDLVLGDNPADDRSLPVIVGGNQSSTAIMQFQCRIGQWIWNAILTELRANSANNHSLW